MLLPSGVGGPASHFSEWEPRQCRLTPHWLILPTFQVRVTLHTVRRNYITRLLFSDLISINQSSVPSRVDSYCNRKPLGGLWVGGEKCLDCSNSPGAQWSSHQLGPHLLCRQEVERWGGLRLLQVAHQVRRHHHADTFCLFWISRQTEISRCQGVDVLWLSTFYWPNLETRCDWQCDSVTVWHPNLFICFTLGTSTYSPYRGNQNIFFSLFGEFTLTVVSRADYFRCWLTGRWKVSGGKQAAWYLFMILIWGRD